MSDVASGPDASQPLLTIAVPTYNRSANLRLLIDMLRPQLDANPSVELLVLENCSPDDTSAVMQQYLANGLRCRYIRHAENIGSDSNFVACYTMAAGKFVWVFGDDDVIFPGALDRIVAELGRSEYEVAFLAPFGFVKEPTERRDPDSHARSRTFTDPVKFLRAVGLLGDLALISAVIVNKNRIESAGHRPFEDGMSTNLVQLGWVLTAVRHLRRGIVFDAGLYAVCELNPSRPFDVIRIFGENWYRVTDLYLQHGSRLWRAVLQEQLASWFVTNWYGMRRLGFDRNTKDPVGQMRPFYGRMPAFWLRVWPLLRWPMLPAGGWLAMLRGLRVLRRAWLRHGMSAPAR